ncbi:flippase-like domain-containing protein, partial [Candidatus Fermentibacteria bacterium]|nr:flippase-like domain-containing protein [Candidatus Fermentibacteria bacterium]
GYLCAAILLGFVPWLTHSLRLLVWTRFLGAKVSFRDLMAMVVGTELGSAVSPTAVGGGYVKLAMLVHRGIRPGAAASLMTLGSLEDGIFFAFALPAALAMRSTAPLGRGFHLGDALEARARLVVMILSITAVFVAGVAARKVTHSLTLRLKAAWNDYIAVYRLILHHGKLRFGITLMLTGIQWICRYSVVSALLASLGVQVFPVRFFALQWVVFTLGVFVPTPGALGGAEAAFFLVYRSFIPENIVGIATAGWRFLTFYLQLAVGLVVFGVLQTSFPAGPASPREMASRADGDRANRA